MSKPPGIPYALIEKLRGEAPTVIAGFLNVVIFWIDQGKLEPIEEARIERLCLLPRNIWLLHGKLIVERLNEFWEPMIEHWLHRKHQSGVYSRNAAKARRAKKARLEAIKHHVTSVTEITLKDAAEAFSMQPTRLERKKPPLVPPKKQESFKPTLRDE